MSEAVIRYARAGLEASLETGGEAEVEKLAVGLKAFAAHYEQVSDLRELVNNPEMFKERAEVLAKVCGALGISEIGFSLIRVLTDNDRLDEVVEIANELRRLADENAGRRRARVLTAIELTTEQEARVAKALEKRVGLPVEVEVKVDPSILGGLVCELEDTTIDTSIKRQLEILSERLYRAS